MTKAKSWGIRCFYFSKLEQNCLAMCLFLLYNEVDPWEVCVYPLPLEAPSLPASHSPQSSQSSELSSVQCSSFLPALIYSWWYTHGTHCLLVISKMRDFSLGCGVALGGVG